MFDILEFMKNASAAAVEVRKAAVEVEAAKEGVEKAKEAVEQAKTALEAAKQFLDGMKAEEATAKQAYDRMLDSFEQPGFPKSKLRNLVDDHINTLVANGLVDLGGPIAVPDPVQTEKVKRPRKGKEKDTGVEALAADESVSVELVAKTVAEPEAPAVEEAVAEPEAPAVEGTVAEPEAPAVEGTVAEPEAPAVEGTVAEPEAPAVEEAVAEPEAPAVEGTVVPVKPAVQVSPFVRQGLRVPTFLRD